MAFFSEPSRARLSEPKIPCALGSYQVVAKNKIAVSCSSVKTPVITRTVTIKAVVNNSVMAPIVSTGLLSVAENTYLVLMLQTDVVGGTDYEAEVQGTSGTPSLPFDSARVRFSTKPNGVLQLPIQVMPTDHGYGRELYIVSTNELENPQSGYVDLQSEDAPGVFVPDRATTSAFRGSVRNHGELYLEFKT